MHHRRAEGDGRLAEAMRDSDRRDAIHRSVLDRGIRHSRAGKFRSLFGECTGDQEFTRAQERRAGESVVDEAAHLWPTTKFVSANAADSHDAYVQAAAQ